MMVPGKVHSVLIVEDEQIVAMDLQETLASMGYDAFAIATSADEALRRVSERCPDLVLMDIRLKGERDGIETAALLRDHFGVPVVYLTAHADEATIARAKDTEPYGYMMKPVRTAELRSMIDVSIYKHDLEQRLRARERWFSTTLRSITDAVVAVDLEGNVQFMNQAAETLTGMAADRAIGRSVRDVVPATSIRGTMSDTASPVIQDGRVLGAVMVFRDVTGPGLIERRHELADRLASLATMAAGIAHELNSPLAVVLAQASYMLDELRRAETTGEPGLRAVVEAMQAQSELESAAHRIARIVTDLQTFAQPAPPLAGEADVGATVDQAVRSTADALESRARVTARIAQGLRVRVEEPRLAQILVNLLVNAAEAIAPGRASANTVEIAARADGGDVVIELRDTGCGMPEEAVARIFEPFYTTKPDRTGLGLAICHGIIRSAGGRIEVESRVGEGSTFRITLPAVIRRGSGAAVVSVLASPPARGRVLAIDDEPMVLQAMKRMLSRHDMVCLDDARAALALLAGGDQFDVIFCDVIMPHMTGIELYERLLVAKPEAARRIVFLSGGSTHARISDFLAAVPNLIVEKPVSTNVLRGIIEQRLAARDQG